MIESHPGCHVYHVFKVMWLPWIWSFTRRLHIIHDFSVVMEDEVKYIVLTVTETC